MSDANVMLEQVQLPDLDAIWPHLEPDLSEACDAVLTSWTPASIRAAVLAGELTLWAIYDIRQPLPVLGALTTSFKRNKDETVVSFNHVGGRDLYRWYEQVVDEIETLGKQQGATIAEMEGRPGWARQMRGLGYRTARVVIQKAL